MSIESPSVEEYEGIVEIQYDSDGVLAIPEGAEYSRKDGEFEKADSNQLLALEEGSEVYLESDTDFAAYDVVEFAKALSGASGDTEVWNPNNTKVWDPESSSGDTTKVFDPSDYDIEDPEEYTKMMKENADTIILELADRDVAGKEVTQTLDSLFDNMNETYDRFVHGSENQDTGPKEETQLYSKKKKEDTKDSQEAGKRKISPEKASNKLDKIEKELEESSEQSRSLDDYEDVQELLHGRQSEIQDFKSISSEIEEGQSEISDF